MKQNYKELWKKLEGCLKYEKHILKKVIKEHKKLEEYAECLKLKTELQSVLWIEEEMESLENTGELL